MHEAQTRCISKALASASLKRVRRDSKAIGRAVRHARQRAERVWSDNEKNIRVKATHEYPQQVYHMICNPFCESGRQCRIVHPCLSKPSGFYRPQCRCARNSWQHQLVVSLASSCTKPARPHPHGRTRGREEELGFARYSIARQYKEVVS